MTTQTATWGADQTQTTTLSGMLAAMIETIRRARSKRRTEVVLSDLDDHVLADIGLDPGAVRRRHHSMADWVVHTQSGTARLVFIGR